VAIHSCNECSAAACRLAALRLLEAVVGARCRGINTGRLGLIEAAPFGIGQSVRPDGEVFIRLRSK